MPVETEASLTIEPSKNLDRSIKEDRVSIGANQLVLVGGGNHVTGSCSSHNSPFPPLPGRVMSPYAPEFVPFWYGYIPTPPVTVLMGNKGGPGEGEPSLHLNDKTPFSGNSLEVAKVDTQVTDDLLHSLKTLTEMASFSEAQNAYESDGTLREDFEELVAENPLAIDMSRVSTSYLNDEDITEWETDGASIKSPPKSDIDVAPINTQSKRVTRSVYTKEIILEKQAREGLTKDEEIKLQLFMPSSSIQNLDFDLPPSPKMKRKGKGKLKKRK